MYILECADGTYYTGSTINLERRLAEHNGCFPKNIGTQQPASMGIEEDRGANYTKKRRPVKLVYYEEYSRIDEAFYREKQVQNWSHEKKRALIENKKNDLHDLSECKNRTHFKNASLDSACPEFTAKVNEGLGKQDFQAASTPLGSLRLPLSVRSRGELSVSGHQASCTWPPSGVPVGAYNGR